MGRRRSGVARVEREAQEHLDRMMADEERTAHEGIGRKDEWYAVKAQQEIELEQKALGLSEKDKVDDRSALQAKREGLNKEVKRFKQQEGTAASGASGKSKEGELAQMIEYQERLKWWWLGVDEAREQ